MKERVDKKRRDYIIQKGDKVLLSIKNLIDKKLDKLFIEAFKVRDLKGVIASLELPGTGIFPKFYIRLLKRAPATTPLATY